MKYSRIVSRLVSMGLLMVLLVMAGASLWITVLNEQAGSAEETSTSRSDLYSQALYEISIEESAQFEYALGPSLSLRQEHLADANAFIALLRHLQQDGKPDDMNFAGQILTEQTTYLLLVNRYFADVDTQDLSQAHTIHSQQIDPLLNRIHSQMREQVNQGQAQATDDQAQLSRIQHQTFLIMPIMFATGLLLTIILGWINRKYQRKIDQSVQAEMQRLEQLALTDPLTDLGNHYAFQERLSQTLKEAHRDEGGLALALIDIDEFKVFNDEQGHQRGDEVLLALAALLRRAELSNALFRLGGDDFAMIISPQEGVEIATALERLRKDVERRLAGITISIGIGHATSDNLNRELLSAQATAALQEAKRRGRNRLLTFEEIEGTVSIVMPAKIQALRRFLSEGKLNIAFQPIWNLAQGKVQAFEALARPAADYGFEGPQEMFDIAEHMGRAHELDAICVRSILERASELPADTLLFLNLTPQTFVHDLLTGALLLEATVSAGLPPSRIVLEITERSIVELDEIIQKVKLLRLMGFQFALDDAGAGNAGLEMLSQLSVDFVKVDRAVVNRANTDQAAYSVLVGITAIARESHISVIAEGIENRQILALVQQLKVQYGQGYLLGRPSETTPDVNALQDRIALLHMGSPETSAYAEKGSN